jgi:hypothetical protein
MPRRPQKVQVEFDDPGEARRYEEAYVVAVRSALDRGGPSGVQIIDLRLEGSYPATTIVVETRRHGSEYSETFDFALWNDDLQQGEEPDDPADLANQLVMELSEEFACSARCVSKISRLR